MSHSKALKSKPDDEFLPPVVATKIKEMDLTKIKGVKEAKKSQVPSVETFEDFGYYPPE